MRRPEVDYHGFWSSLLGPVDPSFRALSGRLKFTVRRHKFNEDSFPLGADPSTSGVKTIGQPNWFRGGLVFKAHRLLYHSALGLRVIKKKTEAAPNLPVQKHQDAEPVEQPLRKAPPVRAPSSSQQLPPSVISPATKQRNHGQASLGNYRYYWNLFQS